MPDVMASRRRVPARAKHLASLLSAAVVLLVAAPVPASEAFQWHRVSIAGRDRCLPVAVSPADQERGLQGVTRVVRPMVFVFSPPAKILFWMKDTPSPLTGVWVGAADRVIGYWHGQPESTRLHPSPAPVSSVIEYRAGAAVPARGARVVVGGRCPAQPGGL